MKLIDLRKRIPELVFGNYEPVTAPDHVLAYRRTYDGHSVLIALNFTATPTSLHVEAGEILVTTQLDRKSENVSGALELGGDEGVIVRLR